MNVNLMPNDINVEFYFHPTEIHKSDEDIKCLYYNNEGSIIAIVTKSNVIKFFECLGKSVIFTINYFKDSDHIINYISWSANSDIVYITYENKKLNITGITKVLLNFNIAEVYNIFEEQKIFIYCNSGQMSLEATDKNIEKQISPFKIKEGRLYSLNSQDDVLLVSGEFPFIYSILKNEIFAFFISNQRLEGLEPANKYTFTIKESTDSNSFFLFVKELYMIILLKENNTNTQVKHKFLMEQEKNLTQEQNSLLGFCNRNLIPSMLIIDLFAINTNGEIFSVTLNKNKNLILVNSTDRVLRLYRYDFDNITLIKEYVDSVNKRKWINAHFYTFKIKNNIQDLIVSALADTHSLEFIFIDIETGNYLKRLEPYKYQCSDFICHYTNHFSIVLISGKKLFTIIGYLLNNWGAFAPQLKYIEENIEFIEDECYFDNFNKYLKKKNIKEKEDSQKSVKDIFSQSKKGISRIRQNLFFKYIPMDDDLAQQSEKDIRELFQQFNEIIEINNNIKI